MALTPGDRADRKLVNQFLAGDGAQASGFLGTLNRDINAGKQARAAQRQVNRAIGAGPWQGRSPFAGTPQPTGAGGRAILQQGLGPVPPVQGPGQLAIPGMGGNAARPAAPSVAQVTPGSPSRPFAMGPLGSNGTPLPPQQGQLPFNAPPSAPPSPGPTASVASRTSQAAAQTADDYMLTAQQAMANGADDVAAASVKQAGVEAGKAGAVNPGMAQRLGINVTKGSLMRGGGVAAGGYMVSQFFDGLNLGGEQSVLDKGGSGALLGAGLGGGAAMALGLATPHVAAAALGGAAILGATRAIFGGKDTKLETATKAADETRKTVTELGNMYGLSPEAMDDIMLQYDASMNIYKSQKDAAGMKNFLAGITANMPALMLQAREEDKTRNQEQERYQMMMQTQAQFAPIFESALDRSTRASQAATAMANNAAGYLDQRHPGLAALYRQTAAQSEASAANLNAAYARQMAEAPITAGTTDELERQLAMQDLANQQAQAQAQIAYG